MKSLLSVLSRAANWLASFSLVAIRVTTAAIVAVVLLPAVALAGDGGDFLSGVLSGVLTPENIGLAVGAILTLLGGWLAKLASTEIRRRNVATAIRHAYAIVEETARLDGRLTVLDKVSAGLKAADTWMVANGWRPLTDAEKQRAKLGFSEISGISHVQGAIAAGVLGKQPVAAVPTTPRAS